MAWQGQPQADGVQGVRERGGGHAGAGAGQQAAGDRHFAVLGAEDALVLVVGGQLGGGVGEDADDVHAVALRGGAQAGVNAQTPPAHPHQTAPCSMPQYLPVGKHALLLVNLHGCLADAGVGDSGGPGAGQALRRANGESHSDEATSFHTRVACQDAGAEHTWTWNRSLIRSSGAVAVLAQAPAVPPARNILRQRGRRGSR